MFMYLLVRCSRYQIERCFGMYVQYIIFCVYQVNFVLFLIYMYIGKKTLTWLNVACLLMFSRPPEFEVLK